MRETYAYAILDRKAKKLREQTGDNSLRSALDDGRATKDIFASAIVRPSKMLIFSPIVFLLSLYMFILYGYLYLIFTAMPGLFQNEYGFSTGQVGLSYLGLGAGSAFGLVLAGAALDRVVAKLQKKNGGGFKPEYRLPLMILAGVAVPIGLFLFGWTAKTHQHWILPIIGTSFLGFGMTLAFVGLLLPSIGAPSRKKLQSLTCNLDGHFNVSGRRLWSVRRIRGRRQHCAPVPRRRGATAGWRQDV